VDAVLLPTVAIQAPLLDDTELDLPGGSTTVREALLRYTRVANVTGHPAISVPLPAPGLPVGLQVIAADNRTAFAAAEWVAATLRDVS
jgi:Asp-tRNA(Asn)/Glu-tRNA(Gln) amidotransferase A subunit family amidase